MMICTGAPIVWVFVVGRLANKWIVAIHVIALFVRKYCSSVCTSLPHSLSLSLCGSVFVCALIRCITLDQFQNSSVRARDFHSFILVWFFRVSEEIYRQTIPTHIHMMNVHTQHEWGEHIWNWKDKKRNGNFEYMWMWNEFALLESNENHTIQNMFRAISYVINNNT